ncbi:hypothetical protein BIZ83_gp026 [Erwinia phage vB_EamM_ChrisDB]|uniref:hypothetical protein n=1 Tax=Erwinia phage vB_EamM_ChrisDB TaxID=1883371 RepID=UPI00081CFB0A|nr:hypothetical protein BIZ83_gp026 [Erwinia phage vB_EamM_ChrisDB]ANZ48827.1 hypothetical protein CHRISDB_265 [Erwinia phage vB_EamM_ChrisDB]
MSILDDIRARHNIPKRGNTQAQETDSFSPQQRLNAVTLGNVVELTTEVVYDLMKGSNGLSSQVGEQRLLKRDIADMVGNRLAARIQEVASSENGGQA